jgi:hypothetical protein
MADDPADPPVDPADPVQVDDTKIREPTAYEKRLRTENAKYRLEAKTAKEQLTAREAALLADKEQAVTETRTAANQRIIRAELKAAALAAGIVSVDALKMIDTSAITLDDQGEVVVPDDFWTKQKAAYPFAFGQPSTSSTATPPPTTPPAAKLATQMTAEEWHAARTAAVNGR